jgi:hypothetical protein
VEDVSDAASDRLEVLVRCRPALGGGGGNLFRKSRVDVRWLVLSDRMFAKR